MYEYTLVTEIMLCIKIIHFCLPGFFVICKQMYANGNLNSNSLCFSVTLFSLYPFEFFFWQQNMLKLF